MYFSQQDIFVKIKFKVLILILIKSLNKIVLQLLIFVCYNNILVNVASVMSTNLQVNIYQQTLK